MGFKSVLVFFLVLLVLMSVGVASAGAAFINEIHYDNTSGDLDEGLELAGGAGFDLSGWQVLFVNGGNGEIYGSPLNLSGIIPDQQNGFGTMSFMRPGIQNGPDGLALIDNEGGVVQFISYEGSFVGAEGLVDGLQSVDIGVGETSTTEVGFSLQLIGIGSEYSDFSWQNPMENSFGTVNTGQTFSAVPLPASLLLLGPGFLSLLGLGRRKWII